MSWVPSFHLLSLGWSWHSHEWRYFVHNRLVYSNFMHTVATWRLLCDNVLRWIAKLCAARAKTNLSTHLSECDAISRLAHLNQLRAHGFRNARISCTSACMLVKNLSAQNYYQHYYDIPWNCGSSWKIWCAKVLPLGFVTAMELNMQLVYEQWLSMILHCKTRACLSWAQWQFVWWFITNFRRKKTFRIATYLSSLFLPWGNVEEFVVCTVSCLYQKHKRIFKCVFFPFRQG